MTLTQALRKHSLPVQIEGFPYIFGGAVLLAASLIVWWAMYVEAGAGEADSRIWFAVVATALSGLFTAFSVWFYRCPDVQTPSDDPQAVISTASGRVLSVKEVAGGKIGEKLARKVSIFMSPFDVHVNRAPLAGVIESIDYMKGKFWKADLDKASEENEHNWIIIRSDQGPRVAFAQIAGFVARRIVVYVHAGERLNCGERYGMIRFGSRAEIIVPQDAEILVQPGQKVAAGITKLARLRA